MMLNDAAGEARDRETRKAFKERLPPRLFRYMRIRNRIDRFETIVLKSRLRFSRYDSLNDPFEGSVPWSFVATSKRIRAYWADYIKRMNIDADLDQVVEGARRPETHQLNIAATRKNVAGHGVVCLSERADDIPMWSYYADGHQGVCLRFRTDKLYGSPYWKGCFPPLPVKYASKYPTIPFYRSTWLELVHALLATKARIWKHEKEWRIVRYEGAGEYPLDPAALDGVVLGCRMPGDIREQVLHIVRLRNPIVPILQVRSEERIYKLVISEVSP